MAPRTRRPRARRPRRRQYGGNKFNRLRRQAMVYSQTYTEVLPAGNIQCNAGGVFVVRFADIPQASNYMTLYKQFCIKKLQVMLLPRLNSYDANTTLSVATSYWVPRISYSIDDTPLVVAPANETSVLTDNGCKILTLDKKRSITCYPKPNIASVDPTIGTAVATRQRKTIWLNTSNPEVGNPGDMVQHGAIRYWVAANPLYNDYQFDVYYKVTFQMRDPA